jgi:hypothetical protein
LLASLKILWYLLTLYFGNRVMCPASILNKYML